MLVHVGAVLLLGLVLAAAAQPIFTDDTWWHLALGRAYLEEGLFLARDPLLFTATGPPAPAAWLSDVLFFSVYEVAGFQGLRVLHAGTLLVVLGLAWRLLRSVTGSAAAASLGVALMAAASAYRLVQLRPHLATIGMTLALFALLCARPVRPSWRRVLLAGALIGVWSQFHPAYPLGPLLLAGSATGLFAVSWIRGPEVGSLDRARAGRFAAASVLGVLASAVHPMGLDGYRKVLALGSRQESLAVVADEWSPIDLFTWPTASLPPSPFSWVLVWILLGLAPIAAARVWREWTAWRRGAQISGIDPIWSLWAIAGFGAAISATRFLWLLVFPIGWVLAALAPGLRRAAAGRSFMMRAAAGGAVLGLAPLFVGYGDWPMISRGLPPTLAGFAQPYAASKYRSDAVFFLADADLEGRLFGRYADGGFQAFWLAPRIRTAMNGTLNVPETTLQTCLAIRERLGTPAHPRFEDALDALGVDLFLGTGLPVAPRPGRPPRFSTLHLEATPGWVLIFRNLDSALYLRRNDRNAANLARVADYYRERGVPFDARTGFDVGAARTAAPAWSRARGLVLRNEADLAFDGRARRDLALGLFDAAERANDRWLSTRRDDFPGLTRRLWLALRPSRVLDAERVRASVRALEGAQGPSALSTPMLEIARQWLAREPLRRDRVYLMPVFERDEASALLALRAPMEIRRGRSMRSSGLNQAP